MTHPLFRKEIFGDYVDTSLHPLKQRDGIVEAAGSYNAALDLIPTALRRDPRGREVYWCAEPFGPRFRSSSVMDEFKGSCARVARTPPAAMSHLIDASRCLRRASAQAPGARCALAASATPPG